jgi:hypothetical protein
MFSDDRSIITGKIPNHVTEEKLVFAIQKQAKNEVLTRPKDGRRYMTGTNAVLHVTSVDEGKPRCSGKGRSGRKTIWVERGTATGNPMTSGMLINRHAVMRVRLPQSYHVTAFPARSLSTKLFDLL